MHVAWVRLGKASHTAGHVSRRTEEGQFVARRVEEGSVTRPETTGHDSECQPTRLE
jgi:hypothetical protein